MKKIVFLTNTRADYGKLKSLITKVEQSKDFDCHIFVTGMHTLKKYGSTFLEIKWDGYKNIYYFINQSNNTDMDITLSNTVLGFSNYIKELKPDLVIIHGDRIETMAGAVVGAINNILVAHIEGGELSGTIDETIRHAITKMSHIHFVSNEQAKQRLIQMGESEKSVFMIGSPDIDLMLSSDLPRLSDVKKHYEILFDKYCIFCYHPVTTELDSLKGDIDNIISALVKSDKNYVCIYPNNDPGSDVILNKLLLLKKNKKFRVIPSMRFEYYLTLLKKCDFIIGNSSSGIREARVYGIPSINIGTRQSNRSKDASVLNINADNETILDAISNIKPIERNYEFGKGDSTEQFFDILSQGDIWNISYQKQFVETDDWYKQLNDWKIFNSLLQIINQ